LAAVRRVLLFCGSAGLVAVVALFDPLMPNQARTAFTIILFLLMIAAFVTLVAVLLTGHAEGMPLGRNTIRPEDITPLDRAAFFIALALLVASAVLTAEAVPFMALLFAWLAAWSALRVLAHRQAIDRLAQAPADH
jgi:hypothetical protein